MDALAALWLCVVAVPAMSEIGEVNARTPGRLFYGCLGGFALKGTRYERK